MLFNSIEFLLFFPAVVLLYYAIPGKLRVFWILLTSYLFYMNWNPAYALLLLFSTAVTFLFGLLIGKRRTKEKAAAGGRTPDSPAFQGLGWRVLRRQPRDSLFLQVFRLYR